MLNFAERFKKLMEEAGLTSEQMAKLLDIGTVSVEGLLTGYSQPNEAILKRIAQIFNVSLRYIALLEDEVECNEDPLIKEVYVVGSVSGANGELMRKDIVDTVYMNVEKMHGKEYFATVVYDDAMSRARICKGDTAIIRKQSSASDGDVVFCMVEGKSILRRFRRSGNIVILTSEGDKVDNPIIKIDTTETKFIILGVVTEIRINKI